MDDPSTLSSVTTLDHAMKTNMWHLRRQKRRSYNPVDSTEYVPSAEIGIRPSQQQTAPASWARITAVQFLCFLWLGPMVSILYLNFSEYKIGANAWCPSRDCEVDIGTSLAWLYYSKANHADHTSRNLLGALQIIAKILEVWFDFIAGLLVYVITMNIANSNLGLPIGMMTALVQYAKPTTCLEPRFWSAAHVTRQHTSRRYPSVICVFVAFLVIVCTLCNLMGPASAVLVLPTLQWRQGPKSHFMYLKPINSTEPPALGGWLDNISTSCNNLAIPARNFSCLYHPWGRNFDAWFEDGVEMKQGFLRMEVNSSMPEVKTKHKQDQKQKQKQNQNQKQIAHPWVPSRQLISEFVKDALTVESMSNGSNYTFDHYRAFGFIPPDWKPQTDSTFKLFDRSLEVELLRKGPAFAFNGSANLLNSATDEFTTVRVDTDKWIRCYDYTIGKYQGHRCIQIGKGWSGQNSNTSFEFSTYNNFSSHDYVRVSAYTSSKVAFYSTLDSLPPYLHRGCLPRSCHGSDCLDVSEPPSFNVQCDWDQWFDETYPVNITAAGSVNNTLASRTSNATTIEFALISPVGANDTDGWYSGATSKLAMFVVDFTARYGIASYTLDPSPVSNPGRLVYMKDSPLDSDAIPLTIHAAWVLAAWAANEGSKKAPAGAIYQTVWQTLHAMLGHNWNPTLIEQDVSQIAYATITQVLSMLEYQYEYYNGKPPPNQTEIYFTARMHEYGYGFGSRSAILSATVVIAGVVLVMCEVVMGLLYRREHRSLLELLVSALEHQPQDEFRDGRRDVKQISKVRYQVYEADHLAGKLAFHPCQFQEHIELRSRDPSVSVTEASRDK